MSFGDIQVSHLKKWIISTNGATAVEYALIMTAVALSISGIVLAFGVDIADMYSVLAGILNG